MIASPEVLIAGAVKQVLPDHRHRPLVVGICGAQGSGKSTVAKALSRQFAGAPVLSLDDLYLPRAERQTLAQTIHPLFATRGVPGTHDVALGLKVLNALQTGEIIRLPRFDKRIDDRVPEVLWPSTQPNYKVAFVEGWCAGAEPQRADELVQPVNELEADEDTEGQWRNFVNEQLSGSYKALFDKFDLLVFLAAPSFEVVFNWRREQEAALRCTSPDAEALMDDQALVRFVAHFERLTRHLLTSMTSKANLVIELDRDRRCIRSYANLDSPLVAEA